MRTAPPWVSSPEPCETERFWPLHPEPEEGVDPVPRGRALGGPINGNMGARMTTKRIKLVFGNPHESCYPLDRQFLGPWASCFPAALFGLSFLGFGISAAVTSPQGPGWISWDLHTALASETFSPDPDVAATSFWFRGFLRFQPEKPRPGQQGNQRRSGSPVLGVACAAG